MRLRRSPAPALAARAWEADAQGRPEQAVALMTSAVRADPSSERWFDLGLLHKRQRDWPASLSANLEAARLDPRNEAACWNGGIAATALADWPTARRLWAAYGVTLPPGDGEPVQPIGRTPVRVDPQGSAEVVWGLRLDPARALLESVPTPACDRRWHDVVLHDGEPRGERQLAGRWVPVFDELALWRRSPYPRLQVRVSAGSPAEVEALVDAFLDAGRGAEDWTGSVRALCAACSEGRAEPGHEHPPMDDWVRERSVGLGCEPELAASLLDGWVAAAPDRRDRGALEPVD